MTSLYEQLAVLAATTPYYEFPLQKGLSWSARSAPHGLISGETGSGKSFFVNYVLAMAAIKGATLYLCDPKNSDLASLADFMPENRVACDAKGICLIVEEVEAVMTARYEYMKQERIARNLFQADFVDFELPLVFLVMDELAAFVSTLGKKERECFDASIKSLTLQGRQAGICLCFLMQNPGTQNISTESRSQMGLRVYLGNSGGIEHRMLFGDGYTLPKRVYKVGEGLSMISGKSTRPELLQTPRLDKTQLGDTLKRALKPQFDIDPFALPSRSEAEGEQREVLGRDYDLPNTYQVPSAKSGNTQND